jgi:hypothetical protein
MNMRIFSRLFRVLTLVTFCLSLLLNIAMFASTTLAAATSGIIKAATGIDTVIEKQKNAVTKASKRISRRVVVGATRNIATMFGEAVPFIGIAVIVGTTTWELQEACETLKDVNELESAFGSTENAGEDIRTVCGQTVPSKEEVWESVKTSPEKAWGSAKEQIPSLPKYSDGPERLTPPSFPDFPDWLSWLKS